LFRIAVRLFSIAFVTVVLYGTTIGTVNPVATTGVSQASGPATPLGRQRKEGQQQIEELLAALADARTAAMISGSEAAALRARIELLTERRPWWRRWAMRWS
jgi:hypothetical protein